MKYTIVGDIHGKYECVEKALSNDGTIVFVGDFLDSYDRPIEDHENCLKLLFEACEKEKAIPLWGNHEMSYWGRSWRCSGWSMQGEHLFEKYKVQFFQYFRFYLALNRHHLITHAGLTRQLSDKYNLYDYNTGIDEEKLDKCILDRSILTIGRRRGGSNSVGGITWCDWSEFEPIPGLVQICGHSGGEEIRQKDYSFCIDCLDYKLEFFELEI